MNAYFDFIPLYKKQIMKDLMRRVNLGVKLNKKDNIMELRKEAIPVMIKLIEDAWGELILEVPDRPIGCMVCNFFNDDSGEDKEQFMVMSVNNDGTGFYCGNLVMVPEASKILS